MSLTKNHIEQQLREAADSLQSAAQTFRTRTEPMPADLARLYVAAEKLSAGADKLAADIEKALKAADGNESEEGE